MTCTTDSPTSSEKGITMPTRIWGRNRWSGTSSKISRWGSYCARLKGAFVKREIIMQVLICVVVVYFAAMVIEAAIMNYLRRTANVPEPQMEEESTDVE